MSTQLERDISVVEALDEENSGTEEDRIMAIRRRFRAALVRRLQEHDNKVA